MNETGLWHPTVPGLDCLSRGHVMVEHREGVKEAQWCLWCGTGVSNEHEAGWGAGAPSGQEGTQR